MPVVFHNLFPVSLKKRNSLKEFIKRIFKVEGKSVESVNIIFCSDEYLSTINKQHLQHDFYTDIVTFDLSDSMSSKISAELYISVERVKENSVTHKVSFNNELHRVIFHGILHLCGYGDKSSNQIIEMRQKEDLYLKLYFE